MLAGASTPLRVHGSAHIIELEPLGLEDRQGDRGAELARQALLGRLGAHEDRLRGAPRGARSREITRHETVWGVVEVRARSAARLVRAELDLRVRGVGAH